MRAAACASYPRCTLGMLAEKSERHAVRLAVPLDNPNPVADSIHNWSSQARTSGQAPSRPGASGTSPERPFDAENSLPGPAAKLWVLESILARRARRGDRLIIYPRSADPVWSTCGAPQVCQAVHWIRSLRKVCLLHHEQPLVKRNAAATTSTAMSTRLSTDHRSHGRLCLYTIALVSTSGHHDDQAGLACWKSRMTVFSIQFWNLRLVWVVWDCRLNARSMYVRLLPAIM